MQKPKRQSLAAGSCVAAGAFAFCERASGAIRFQVRAGTQGELPTEEAAILLAMHCLIRAQRPQDYVVLVVPDRDLLGRVSGRAEHLLCAGRSAAESTVRLSGRQREVLDHVLQDLSNKEVGVRLNISERTVKFHVSQLLAKFHVSDRGALKHAAAIGMVPSSAVPGDTLFGFLVPPGLTNGSSTPQSRLLDPRSERNGRIPQLVEA
jgi:DNA-binding CsgD family transcriptional regulator